MEADVHTNLSEFAELTRERFAKDPVWHTVAVSALHRLQNLPQPDDQQPTMVSLHQGDKLAGSLFRTPPWPLQVTDLPLAEVDLAVDLLRRIDPELPGVTGPSEVSVAFATSWSDAPEQVLSTRLYRLAKLEPPDVPGSFRMADESDIPLLSRWRDDFTAEALPFPPPGPPAGEVLRRSFALDYGMAVWELDGVPVAWATAGPPTAGMSRIGPVYTPPAHRRHGYGAAVTAAVSRWAVETGAEHVVLFADLLNPISNSIYQHIGFRPVCDWAEYRWRVTPGRVSLLT